MPRERPSPDTNLLLHAVILGISGGIVYVVRMPWGMVVAFPVAWVISRWIVMLIGKIKRRAEEDATGDWNGRYFEYEGRQVRIYWDRESIWIVADDVFVHLGERPDAVARKKTQIRLGADHFAKIPDVHLDGFSEDGLLRYLGKNQRSEFHRLKLWFEREVFPNIHKRLERE